jgi:hypothetical protein
MNAISQMCYKLPLYSSDTNTDEMKNLWEKLADNGLAIKFEEADRRDRYVFPDKHQ